MASTNRTLVNLGRSAGGTFLFVEQINGMDAIYYTAYWDHRDNSFRLYYRSRTSVGRNATPIKSGTKVYDDNIARRM